MAAVSTAPERLPVRTRLIYGLGDWGNTTTSTFMIFFFSFFLTDVAKLSPLYAAPVLLIGGVWDAINDPLLGVLVDRVRSRWGRRRPIFLFGALPLAVTFIMLWWVPPGASQVQLAAYYTIAYVLFDTAFTLVSVPYSALTAELTEDYDERTTLTGYRMAVSMIGGLAAAVGVPLIADQFGDPRAGYFLAALIFGILAGLPYLMLFVSIRERRADEQGKPLNIAAEFLLTFRNRPFRFAAGIYMAAWTTINLVAALMVYYLTYWMRMGGQIEIVLGLVQVAALVAVPVIVWLSGRIGKKSAYIFGVSWWAVVMLALAFLPPGAEMLTFLLAGFAGIGVAAAHVIPWSIVPDVIEADELATGQRREGVYYGFLVFLMKAGTALALALVQWVLHLTGYQAGAVQPESALSAIRALIGPLPAALLLLSIFLAWRYPIGRSQHAAMRATLAEKRAISVKTSEGD